MKAEEFFNENYKGHEYPLANINLHGESGVLELMEKFADIKAKEAYEANQVSKEDFQSLINNSLRDFSEDEISTDVALDLGGILYDNLIEIFPTYEQWKESKTKEQ